ncbi:MAG: serine protease, partial [Bacteroidota bacterium]
GVDNGVLVSKLTAGKLRSQTKMRENFVILEVNGQTIESSQELIRTLDQTRGEVTLTGFYPGYRRVYSYAFRR